MCYMHYSIIDRLLLIRPDERIFEVIVIMKYAVLITYMYVKMYTYKIFRNLSSQWMTTTNNLLKYFIPTVGEETWQGKYGLSSEVRVCNAT